MRHILLGLVAISLIVPGQAVAQWPQWRGPGRDGIVPADLSPPAWPEALKKGWSVEVGEGYSSPIVGDGRAFVHSRQDPDEVVSALDLETGKVVWQQRYPAPFAKNPYAKSMAKGPYATPLLSDGKLFTLGTSGILSAWNAQSGALLWRKDFSSKVDTSKLFCGTAISPIRTVGGVVVYVGDDRAGELHAFAPDTGDVRWTKQLTGPGYASPIEIAVAGTPQLVTMTTRSVVGLSASTGDQLWEFPFADEWNENIVTPVFTGTAVIVSGVRQGTRALEISQSGGVWTVRETWHTPDVTMYMSSPVLVDGVLFGHSSKRKGQFVAVDPATGRVRWSTEGRNAASAAVLAAARYLLFLTSESELIIARLDRDAFQQVRRYTVASSPTYAHPVLLRNRLYLRDASHLTVWNLD